MIVRRIAICVVTAALVGGGWTPASAQADRAKLAAALSDDDGDEIGMTIAYLKRALKAITIAMDGAAQLLGEKLITPAQYSVVQQRLFQVRDGIITLMGEYRGEWRRRYGNR